MEKIQLTKEQYQQRLLEPEGTYPEDQEIEIIDGDGGQGGDGGQAFTPSPYWDLYKTKLPEEQRANFKLPENISAENEQQLLDDHFKTIYGTQMNPDDILKDIPPLAKEIIEAAKDPQFNPNEFINKKATIVSAANMSGDDLVYRRYVNKIGIKNEQNPNGLSEEEIRAEIAKMNPLDKKVIENEERAAIQQEIEKQIGKGNNDPAAMQKAIETHNSQISTFADTYFSDKRANPEKARTIAGVELSEAEFQAARTEFINDFSVKDGKAKIAELLLNNDEAMAKAYLFLKYEDKISQALTRKFNDGKNFVFDKLGFNPTDKGGNYHQNEGMSQEEMIIRLNLPEGSFKEGQ